jgi:uncharacterized protein YcfJ
MSDTVNGAASGAAIGTMITPGVGTIIGAGIGALGSLFGGWMQNRSNEKINQQMYELALLQRQDQLRQFAFSKEMALNDRTFRNREANHAKRQDQFNRGMQILGRNDALKAQAFQMFGALGRGKK